MSSSSYLGHHGTHATVAGSVQAELPTCDEHPHSLVRRYRSHGPDGPGVYPQCVPSNGDAPHLLAWRNRVEVTEISVDLHVLSPSEHAVLEDASFGLTVQETARKRQKSGETVKTQRRSILLKLGARNMAHAVAIAMEDDALQAQRERNAA